MHLMCHNRALVLQQQGGPNGIQAHQQVTQMGQQALLWHIRLQVLSVLGTTSTAAVLPQQQQLLASMNQQAMYGGLATAPLAMVVPANSMAMPATCL